MAGRVPGALMRALGDNPGFGPAADEALKLVEGAGFFCFLHDDVALDPTAVSELVAETYRSNAGIVGPKLVDWDHPEVLQHVGLSADRLGVALDVCEAGELDQEQHDAVRDVFSVPPRACSCASTSSAPSEASPTTSTSTATTWTCAGGPTSPAPGCWSSPMPAPVTGRDCPSAVLISIRLVLAERHGLRTSLSAPDRAPPRRPDRPARPVLRDRDGGRTAHGPGPAGAGDRRRLALAARPAACALRSAPALPDPAGRSPTPRWRACKAYEVRLAPRVPAPSDGAPRGAVGPAGRAGRRSPLPDGRRRGPHQRAHLGCRRGGAGRGHAAADPPDRAASGRAPGLARGTVRAGARVPRRLVVAGPRRDPSRCRRAWGSPPCSAPITFGANGLPRTLLVVAPLFPGAIGIWRLRPRRSGRAAPRPPRSASTSRSPLAANAGRHRLALGTPRLRRAALDGARAGPAPRRPSVRAPGRARARPAPALRRRRRARRDRRARSARSCPCSRPVIVGSAPRWPSPFGSLSSGSGPGAAGCCSGRSPPC